MTRMGTRGLTPRPPSASSAQSAAQILFAADGRVVDGNAGQDQSQHRQGRPAARYIDDRVREQVDGGQYEQGRYDWVTRRAERRVVGMALPEDINGGNAQRVERYDCRDESVGQLLEGAQQYEAGSQYADDSDGDVRCFKARVDGGNPAEEQLVVGHREEDPR